MGHSIEYFTYPEKTNKKEIYSKLSDYVKKETWQEGGFALSNIKWLEGVVCNDWEEARDYIAGHDSGWYDCLAVRYKELPYGADSKNAKLRELNEKLTKARLHYQELNQKVQAAEFKSSFVSCKNCGSKINKQYLKSNYCPICKFDMRSDTVKKTIRDAELKVHKLEQELKQEERKVANKKGNICWLVKIEYHI